jgi:hypothetical protein
MGRKSFDIDEFEVVSESASAIQNAVGIRGVGLQSFVGDGQATADREFEGFGLQSLLSPVEGRQSVAQAGGDGVVGALVRQWSGGVGEVA